MTEIDDKNHGEEAPRLERTPLVIKALLAEDRPDDSALVGPERIAELFGDTTSPSPT